ncbi:unnamed protein product [Didymodactylos carnosus]|uniref:Uncharacterized protein n=1 Tax=Didymodactylos carnosus TaxID=1234261 RepID=A0A8S2ECP7_9BILA|nr:unnamed protein product [Didymodactylos carnosus]CAF3999926.1 unnamed protein product [Didymodactylos carnosus]
MSEKRQKKNTTSNLIWFLYLGCRKTALINYLCQKLLHDELEIPRIDAGITNRKIIGAMDKNLIPQAVVLLQISKHFWIFFDKLNTTKSVGLIKEIIGERTLIEGSNNCTSESVEKLFERAKKYSDAKTQATMLSVIVFDEIGFTGISLYNPLKVLHSELEIENCKYGSVAISNWRLDALKMNRALYLAYPDPTLNDLQLTAITIHKSMNTFGHV